MICVSSRWGKPWRCQGREGRSGNDWYARSTKDRLPIEARSQCERCASFAASPPRPRSFCRANRASAQIGISKLQFGQIGADGNCDHALNPISLPTAHATLSSTRGEERERGERRERDGAESKSRFGRIQIGSAKAHLNFRPPPLPFGPSSPHPSSPHSVPLFHQQHHILHRRTISHPLTIHHQNRHGLQVLLPSV